MSPYLKQFDFISKENKNLEFYLPWANPQSKTQSIQLREISYDNYNQNVLKGFTLQFLKFNENKQKNEVEVEFTIEAGSYELDRLLEIIKYKLVFRGLEDIKIEYEEDEDLFLITNKSKFIMSLSSIASEFFKVDRKWIFPDESIESYKEFESMRTKYLYILVKNLKTKIHSNANLNHKGYGIIYSGPILNKYGETSHIIQTNTDVDFFLLNKKFLEKIEFKIVNEHGTEVNIKNIRILFRFEYLPIERK